MDHRPFEEWLLNDNHLTPEQTRDLRGHVRNCPSCAALARANLSLRAAPVTVPATGFTLRFQARLVAQRKVERRRSMVGLFLLAVIGMGVIGLVALPYLSYLRLEPWQVLLAWVNELIYIAFTLRTISIVGNTVFNVVASLIPPYAWVLSAALLAVVGALWNVSFRRVGKYARSAT